MAARERSGADLSATAHRPRTSPGGRAESAEHARRGDTDVAVASVMRDALLRRSEAAALTWADVERRQDGTGRLTVRRSKGDQAGEGAELYTGHGAATPRRHSSGRPESGVGTRADPPGVGGLHRPGVRRTRRTRDHGPYPQGSPGRQPPLATNRPRPLAGC